MHKHPLRKFLGLTVLYTIVIVGIFVIQFKTESVISRSFNGMSFSLAQTQIDTNETKLKNRINVSFRGLNFNADDKNPVRAFKADGTSTDLQLASYTEHGTGSVSFEFEQGGQVEFHVLPQENDRTEFSISAKIPEGYEFISLPYKISQQYVTDKVTASSYMLTSKNEEFTFTAHSLEDSRIQFTAGDSIAKFQPYEAVKRFTFDQVTGFEGTTESSFERLSDRLRSTLVAKVQETLRSAKADTLSEMDITAYVAELSSQGKYNQAIDSVPESFKKGNKRSYYSSPYFDNLAVMYRSLSIQNEKYASLVDSLSLDVFNADGISDYILRQKKTQAVKNLLAVPSLNDFNPTVYQAAGIIGVYCNLREKDETLASTLESSLDKCIETIQNGCKFENGIISIHEGDESQLSVEQTVIAGHALYRLGKTRNDTALVQSGLMAIHSALSDETPELRTISAIYTILAPDNFYYPHTEILGYYNSTCVWAWTCAKSTVYTHKPQNTANIFIDFPMGLTHYMIINGVPNFHGKIEIQGQMFRTDPRFETYNSSGYVYQTNSSALLIKSRHKSKMELIRLFFDSNAAFVTTADPSKIPALPAPAPKAEPKPKPIQEDAPEQASPAEIPSPAEPVPPAETSTPEA